MSDNKEYLQQLIFSEQIQERVDDNDNDNDNDLILY